MAYQDLSNIRYGLLVAVCRVGKDANNNSLWACECECGRIKAYPMFQLKSRGARSCGCAQKLAVSKATTTHGMSFSPEYLVWKSMWQRCTNPSHESYPMYKGRTPPDRWKSFEAFFHDMGPRPEGFTIERVRNEEPYGQDNCIWAPREVQDRNKKTNHNITFNGKTMNLTDWAEHLGVSRSVLFYHIVTRKKDMEQVIEFYSRKNGQ